MAEQKSPNNTIKNIESSVNRVAGNVLGKAGKAIGNVLLPVGGGAVLGSALKLVGNNITKIAKGIGLYFVASFIWTLILFIATFAVLLIFIAFTMFIINSGAYVTSPGSTITAFGSLGFDESIECSTEKSPISFGNTATNPIAFRSWQIVSDLYQGFWCFWNRSPVHIATDQVLYPPSYPQHFDYQYFLSNPNPNFTSGPANILFWCTWLVIKSYEEAGGISLPLTTLGADTMRQYFSSNGTLVPSSEATPQNVSPGDVIFFRRPSTQFATHVAVVYSVTQDYVIFVQSNGPTKTASLSFAEDGVGLQDLGVGGDSSSIVMGVGSL